VEEIPSCFLRHKKMAEISSDHSWPKAGFFYLFSLLEE